MSTQTESLSSWLRQIPGDLYRLDDKPLLGFPPEFPWTVFSSKLAESLQLKKVSIAPVDLQWRSQTELFSGLGDHLKTIALSVNPLEGAVWWVMSEQAMSRLMHQLFNKEESKVFSETIDESFFKAFQQFIAVEAINAFEKLDFDKKLAPTVLKETTLPAEACLTLDISLSINEETLYGRLFLSQIFRKSWSQRYLQQQKNLALSSPIIDTLDVIVHLEGGKIDLKPSEWKHIVPGDFVILDSCSLDADEDKGRVMLVINGIPFFRAKIKQGSLKILEHPLYHEVNTTMAPTNKNDKDGFDDSELDDDFDIDDETHDEETHDDEHTDDDDFDIDDLSEIEDKEEAKPAASKEKPVVAPTNPTTVSTTPLSIDEIPLTIIVEVGRLQMSVKKLLELQPGNMLDLDLHPESGVDMVINGKRIARGELLKIGDSLGIRILELS